MQSSLRRRTISLIVGIGIIGLGIGWLAGMSLSPVIANIIATIVTAAAAIVAAVGGLEEQEAAPSEAVTEEGVGQPPDNRTVPQSRTAAAITAAGRLRVNPWPLAALLVGLFFGTSAGNWARANDLFGKRMAPETPLTAAGLQAEVEPWVTQGISKTLVVQRLFELQYPPGGGASPVAAAGSSASQSSEPNPYQTGLYALGAAAGQTECQQIARTTNDKLENLMLGEPNADGLRQPGVQNEVLHELFVTLENPDSFRTVVKILCASAQ